MIFVSYSDLDRERVEPLVIDLGVLGHNVFFEDKSLGGKRRWDEIFTSIEQSDALVYTLTRNTQASYSRLLEYEHALALGKPIIPVRLEPIDIWSLPPGIGAILDYPPQDASTQEEFARVFSSLPPVGAPPAIARPEVSFALSQLADHVNLPNKSAAVKSAIFLNLREFLERRETFVPAETLLGTFAGQLDRTDPLASDVKRLQTQIRYSGAARPLFWRRRVFGGLLFSAAVTAALVLALRAFSASKLPGDPPRATQDPPVTSTLTSLSLATNTVTVTDIPLSTPTEAPSDTLLIGLASSSIDPTATDRSPNGAPPTDPPPRATQSPPPSTSTSTLTPPLTSTPLPTSTSLPPTFTPLPTNTLISILPTMVHILPTTTSCPPTQVPPTFVLIMPTVTPILLMSAACSPASITPPPTSTSLPPTSTPLPTNTPITILPTVVHILPTAIPILPTVIHILPTATSRPPTAIPPTSIPIIPTVVHILPTLVPILPTAKPPTPQPPPTQKPPPTSIPIIPTVVKILPTLVPILPTAKPPTQKPPPTPQPPPTQKPPPTGAPIIPPIVPTVVHGLLPTPHHGNGNGNGNGNGKGKGSGNG